MTTFDVTNIPRLVQWLALWRPGAPLLLDAFCGAGGAAVGYWRAGFNVLGCDNRPQSRYPFPFIQMDAIEFIRQFGPYADAIHASPPCQFASVMTPEDVRDQHQNLIPDTQRALDVLGKPFVIENVPGAEGWLRNPVMLHGSQFGLNVWRKRYFELGGFWLLVPPIRTDYTPVLMAGRGMKHTNGKRYPGDTVAARSSASGIWWMTGMELRQAIPPVYTEYIGAHLLRVVEARREAQTA